MTENHTYVLQTIDDKFNVLSFNAKNDLVGKFTYDSRAGAIAALEKMTGKKITLKPMQTFQSEFVDTQQELEDIPSGELG